MKLYQLNCRNHERDLYRLKDGRIQFLNSNKTAPLMQMGGEKYVLADNKLASFLQSLDLDQVSFQPAVFWNRKSDEEIHTHTQISIGRCLEESRVAHIELDGYQLCFVEGYSESRGGGPGLTLYVSSLLKDALENEGFGYLR